MAAFSHLPPCSSFRKPAAAGSAHAALASCKLWQQARAKSGGHRPAAHRAPAPVQTGNHVQAASAAQAIGAALPAVCCIGSLEMPYTGPSRREGNRAVPGCHQWAMEARLKLLVLLAPEPLRPPLAYRAYSTGEAHAPLPSPLAQLVATVAATSSRGTHRTCCNSLKEMVNLQLCLQRCKCLLHSKACMYHAAPQPGQRCL